MAIDRNFRAQDSTNTDRVIIEGVTSSVEIISGAQVGTLSFKNRSGQRTIFIDGENSSIVGDQGGDITLKDGLQTRLRFDGASGELILRGKLGSIVSVTRDGDGLSVSFGTEMGIILKDANQIKRFVVQVDGTTQMFDAAGNKTFEVDANTGNVRYGGTLEKI